MPPPNPPGSIVWARLSFKQAGGWTLARRKAVAAWLREQAKDLVKNGGDYFAGYIARYMRD